MRYKKQFKKYSLLLLTILIVAGFTLPGALYFASEDSSSTSEDQGLAEGVCLSDSDCILVCNNGSIQNVLCYQNMCEASSCDGDPYHKFSPDKKSFDLKINVQGEDLFLDEFSKVFGQGSIFFTLDDGSMTFNGDNLQVKHLLEKFGMRISGDCLIIGSQQLCSNDQFELTFHVNDEQDYSYEEYFIEEGDDILISYN